MKCTIDEMLEKLPLPGNEKWKDGVWDFEPFSERGIKLVFFAPRGVDYQTHHDEEEFYFISRGSGELVVEEARYSCEAGDVFFVRAKMPHRFENVTDDFATWAIFF